MPELSSQMFFSGVNGVKIASFGFFAGTVLQLSAVQTLGSLGMVMNAGFIGGAFCLVPAMALRFLAQRVLGFQSNSMFVLELALTLASAALGAYWLGLPMASMMVCAALGTGFSFLLDWGASMLANRSPEVTTMFNYETGYGYAIGNFNF